MTDKPIYAVPSMAEITATPRCGLTMVSTFSGCGGSCLGFEMAGYDVKWASEFVPIARETYELNHLGVPVDDRDIREVEPADILKAAGLKSGELDVLEGSPPCAAFSTAGKRAKSWGEVSKYSETAQRSDDLFFEFARLLEGLQPRTFVAENVSGLVKGVAKGYFKEILAHLKGCGYQVEARLLDAQWLGVPQARQRIIFVGVREDLNTAPAFPRPMPYRYSVADALPHINRAVHDTSGLYGAGDITNRPCPTITVGMKGLNSYHYKVEDAPPLGRAIGKEADKIGEGEQSDKYFQLVRADRRKPSPTVTAAGGQPSIASVIHPTERRKFTIPELKRICAFPDDFELIGTYRQQWERLGRSVPPLMMRAVAEVIRDEVLCAE